MSVMTDVNGPSGTNVLLHLKNDGSTLDLNGATLEWLSDNSTEGRVSTH